MPDSASPNSYFRLNMGGAEAAAAFTSFEGLGSKTEVIKVWATDAQGQPVQRSVAGKTSWEAVTLKRGADDNLALWQWHKEVVEKGHAGARRVVTIEHIDYTGKPIATYKLIDAWPCKYVASSMNAAENTASVETVELAHDGCERV